MPSDKTEAPTAKRKREARRDGTLARSGEIVIWAQMLAAGILIPLSVGQGARTMTGVMNQVGIEVARPDASSAVHLLGTALSKGILAIAPLAFGMMAIGLVGNFAQTGLALSGKALKPKFDRLNPKKGLKRLLSPHSVWEVAKAALKLAVLTAVAWPGIAHLGTALAGGGQLSNTQVLAMVGSSTMALLRSTALAGLALAAVDYGFQRRRVRKQLMMTKQEVKEEYKQSEGDPMTRSRIRQRQVEMSRNRMMAAVATASVVVVNPTHIAVALEYRPEWGAPRVVAKGRGHVARRIREEAENHDVPIVRDVPLARTLHSACKLGQAIPADLYEAVARLLAFVFSLQHRAA
ncbi:MAG TPA: EscU/YscU/HrcU family type III secretion system export apparatus switch protein [Acidimicrobiia bacterium]|nr:EscU/YscU/HrcU family type III secretion system export apparatus switch protein [Acidimicrobiia bacterium]